MVIHGEDVVVVDTAAPACLSHTDRQQVQPPCHGRLFTRTVWFTNHAYGSVGGDPKLPQTIEINPVTSRVQVVLTRKL